MLRGKENGDIPRKAHVQASLFITRERGHTESSQEVHFVYNKKLHFLFLRNIVSKPTCIFSLLPYAIKIHSFLFSLQSCRSPVFNIYKKCSY